MTTKDVLVIAPHPDDETLGCGGTLFSHRAQGDRLHWIIFTSIDAMDSFAEAKKKQRKDEIESIASLYEFSSVIEYGYNTCTLDETPKSTMVARLSSDINRINPQIVYIPHEGDIHSDHKVVHEVSLASLKWFRHPSIKIVRVYETLSETNVLGNNTFRPNQFSNIGLYVDKKIEAMSVYHGEMGDYPFPRSEKSIRALANYRGAHSGYENAEAFQVLFEKL